MIMLASIHFIRELNKLLKYTGRLSFWVGKYCAHNASPGTLVNLHSYSELIGDGSNIYLQVSYQIVLLSLFLPESET